MVKWKAVTILFAFFVLLFFTSYRIQNQWKQQIHSINNENLRTILVFIHIQKTAGSEFERSIVRRLSFGNASSCQCPERLNRTQRPSVKLRCNCTRKYEPWLISRFSVGWLCGVHADWTMYHRCLPAKFNTEYNVKPHKFVYSTLLREPIARFISEYLHTLRGATWLAERLPCSKAQQLRNHYACWKNTNLTDFITCPFNSAINRQTRMLSSFHAHSCASSTFTYRNLIDLETAKSNLQSMEFFGLTEYLSLSQRLFELTSYCRQHGRCSFRSYLEQDWNNNHQTFDYLTKNLTQTELEHLRQLNSDDLELYRFARTLFFQRTCRILGVACQ